MNRTLPATLALLTLALTACPAAETPGQTPGPGPTPGQTVTRVGVVTFIEGGAESLGRPVVSGFASFYEVAATPASSFGPAREDVCTVSRGGEPVSPGQPSTTYLDAGAVVTATAGGATYAVLAKQENAGTVFYLNGATEPLPPLPESALSVAVPGAAFPAFTADAPGAPVALELTSPADPAAIGPASSFGWTPAPVTGADTYVFLNAAQLLDDGRTASVYCQLVDDGAFAFAAATQADMQAAGLTSGALVFGGRSSTRTEVEGSAALVLTVSRSTDYAAFAVPPRPAGEPWWPLSR